MFTDLVKEAKPSLPAAFSRDTTKSTKVSDNFAPQVWGEAEEL